MLLIAGKMEDGWIGRNWRERDEWCNGSLEAADVLWIDAGLVLVWGYRMHECSWRRLRRLHVQILMMLTYLVLEAG